MTGTVTLSELTAFGDARAQSDTYDADAVLAQAVREHGRFVFKVAYSVLRNREDAEDAAQETFLRAMKSVREFLKVEDQKAWLARVAWRIAVDRARRTKHGSTDNEALIAQLREIESQMAEATAEAMGAEALVINDQMLGLLQSLIVSLPRELCDVVTLSTVQELTSSEIAAVLGIPEGSVRTRLMRAKALLREKFEAKLTGRSHDRTIGRSKGEWVER